MQTPTQHLHNIHQYSKKFIKDENYARKNNLGFWQTEFEFPWEFKKNK